MENHGSERLTIIAETRAALAHRLTTPWWYHPILGLLLAGFVVTHSLGNAVVRLIALVLFGLACGALMHIYRRLTGVWISGLAAGGASRWAQALGALAGATIAASWTIAHWSDLTWPVWCLAALMFVSTVILGRRFDTALRAQLRADV